MSQLQLFDVGPTSINATATTYTAGATGWTAGIANPATNNTTNTWITGLAQSDDLQGRVGQGISVESLDVRVQVIPDDTVAGHAHLRMVIFSDEEFDGTVPGDTELFGNTATTVANGLAISFLQPGFFGRFHIVEDKHWSWYCSSTANSFEQNEVQNSFWHESHHDMHGHKVMWDATNASAIANARKGHMFVYFYFQNTVVAAGGIPTVTSANPPAVHYTTRIRYRSIAA